MVSVIRFRNLFMWVGCLLLVAVSVVGVQEAKAGGGTLVWGQPAAETVLDPHVGCGAITMYTTYHVTEGLWDQDMNSGTAFTELEP